MKAGRNAILLIIVVSQFFCTTTWFGSNAVLTDLSNTLQLPTSALATLTSAVQFGFISGTLVYALLTIADTYRPSTVFLLNAMAAAVVNALIVLSTDMTTVIVLRFCTGFFLAGIYPVGMKIAADHFDKGLGKALGFLVGALVLGTSFPHLLKSFSVALSWKAVLLAVSGLSLVGGILIRVFVSVGPYRKKMERPALIHAFKMFRSDKFRSAVFGYFGHMWELYTFWAFVPVIINTYAQKHHIEINTSLLSFSVIAVGSLACVSSGYLSQKIGAKRTAFIALICSGCCCLLSPLSFSLLLIAFICFLLFWGWMVIADSPMFSTLISQSAPAEQKGTALTIATSIGFFITILSIAITDKLMNSIPPDYLYLFLAPGPILGLMAMRLRIR